MSLCWQHECPAWGHAKDYVIAIGVQYSECGTLVTTGSNCFQKGGRC